MTMNKAASKRIEAKVTEIEKALDPISDVLEEVGVDHKTCYKVRLALDELLTNVVFYAYDGGQGEVEVSYEIIDDPHHILIKVVDEGKPFNPLTVEDPELNTSVDERKIGGLGLFIVKKTMDEIDYRRENNQNILIIKKNL